MLELILTLSMSWGPFHVTQVATWEDQPGFVPIVCLVQSCEDPWKWASACSNTSPLIKTYLQEPGCSLESMCFQPDPANGVEEIPCTDIDLFIFVEVVFAETIFRDGFETGDAGRWSQVVP